MTTVDTPSNQAIAFEVAKNDLGKTRIVPLTIPKALKDEEVLLKVSKFALTANNISYGIAGDELGYWQFFPTENTLEQEEWGRLPTMGYADVVASNCEHIQVGERVWGFMPMATHFKILAGRQSLSKFSDISPNRLEQSPLYSTYERISKNPFYQANNEDFEILLRGLYTTSWLVDDFMYDNQYFNAQQYLITSASSKTSIALAFAILERGEQTAIGITSAANKAFVQSLGCYEKVVSYEDIMHLDGSIPSIVVDMAGSQTALSSIHHHFGEQIRYSCRIGVTHHNDIVTNEPLPGAKPVFFFAPTQLRKRSVEWGTGAAMAKIGTSLQGYIQFCRSILSIAHTTNKEHLASIYQQVLSGKADASVGQIVSL